MTWDIESECKLRTGDLNYNGNDYPYQLNLYFFERMNALHSYLHGSKCIYGICLDHMRTAEQQHRLWFHEHETGWIIQPFRVLELFQNESTGTKMKQYLSLFFSQKEIEKFESNLIKFVNKYPREGTGNECSFIEMIRTAMEGLFPIANNINWLDNKQFLNGEQNTDDLMHRNLFWAHVPSMTKESFEMDKQLNYFESKTLSEIIRKTQIHDCKVRSKCRRTKSGNCSYSYPIPIYEWFSVST